MASSTISAKAEPLNACSDVIRGALRDWTDKRNPSMQGIAYLHGAWQEAVGDASAGFSADDVLNRLERKYQALAEAGTAK